MLTLGGGRRILLVADTLWVAEQVTDVRARYPGANFNYDRNRMQLASAQRRLRALADAHGVEVIPMLDGRIDVPQSPEAWE